MSTGEEETASTLDELIRQKETELDSLRRLKMKKMEIQFFRGLSNISSSVAAKVEEDRPLTPTERVFRRRMYEGLTVAEILSLLFDKVFRRRKAVIFTPGGT